MNNPWESISLDDYESHMSLDSVNQLQTLDMIMKEQFEAYPAETAMVLGVAGGNGLRHINREKYRIVYGVDINAEYLKAAEERFRDLACLKCIRADLVSEAESLPHAQLVTADLLIEYIGTEAFVNVVRCVRPEYVSCVIQINTDEEKWVSESPYIHAFDGLDSIHHQMEENALTAAMKETGHSLILHRSYPLPNGKALVRLDYRTGGL